MRLHVPTTLVVAVLHLVAENSVALTVFLQKKGLTKNSARSSKP